MAEIRIPCDRIPKDIWRLLQSISNDVINPSSSGPRGAAASSPISASTTPSSSSLASTPTLSTATSTTVQFVSSSAASSAVESPDMTSLTSSANTHPTYPLTNVSNLKRATQKSDNPAVTKNRTWGIPPVVSYTQDDIHNVSMAPDGGDDFRADEVDGGDVDSIVHVVSDVDLSCHRASRVSVSELEVMDDSDIVRIFPEAHVGQLTMKKTHCKKSSNPSDESGIVRIFPENDSNDTINRNINNDDDNDKDDIDVGHGTVHCNFDDDDDDDDDDDNDEDDDIDSMQQHRPSYIVSPRNNVNRFSPYKNIKQQQQQQQHHHRHKYHHHHHQQHHQQQQQQRQQQPQPQTLRRHQYETLFKPVTNSPHQTFTMDVDNEIEYFSSPKQTTEPSSRTDFSPYTVLPTNNDSFTSINNNNNNNNTSHKQTNKQNRKRHNNSETESNLKTRIKNINNRNMSMNYTTVDLDSSHLIGNGTGNAASGGSGCESTAGVVLPPNTPTKSARNGVKIMLDIETTPIKKVRKSPSDFGSIRKSPGLPTPPQTPDDADRDADDDVFHYDVTNRSLTTSTTTDIGHAQTYNSDHRGSSAHFRRQSDNRINESGRSGNAAIPRPTSYSSPFPYNSQSPFPNSNTNHKMARRNVGDAWTTRKRLSFEEAEPSAVNETTNQKPQSPNSLYWTPGQNFQQINNLSTSRISSPQSHKSIQNNNNNNNNNNDNNDNNNPIYCSTGKIPSSPKGSVSNTPPRSHNSAYTLTPAPGHTTSPAQKRAFIDENTNLERVTDILSDSTTNNIENNNPQQFNFKQIPICCSNSIHCQTSPRSAHSQQQSDFSNFETHSLSPRPLHKSASFSFTDYSNLRKHFPSSTTMKSDVTSDDIDVLRPMKQQQQQQHSPTRDVTERPANQMLFHPTRVRFNSDGNETDHRVMTYSPYDRRHQFDETEENELRFLQPPPSPSASSLSSAPSLPRQTTQQHLLMPPSPHHNNHHQYHHHHHHQLQPQQQQPTASPSPSPSSSSSTTTTTPSSIITQDNNNNNHNNNNCCSCQTFMGNFLSMASRAYNNLRDLEDYSNFRQEMAHTNNILRESLAIGANIRAICEHHRVTPPSPTSSSMTSSHSQSPIPASSSSSLAMTLLGSTILSQPHPTMQTPTRNELPPLVVTSLSVSGSGVPSPSTNREQQQQQQQQQHHHDS